MLYSKHTDLLNEIRSSESEEARRLLSENMELIEEMRAETYRSIGEFGEVLLRRLAFAGLWGTERFRSMKTSSQGAYGGGKIHYLWIEPATVEELTRKVCEVGMVIFGLPIPYKVPIENDVNWQSYWCAFDVLALNSLKVWIGYDGIDPKKKDRVMGVAATGKFGTHLKLEGGSRCSMRLSLRGEDPVGSAVERLTALIRGVYQAQYVQEG